MANYSHLYPQMQPSAPNPMNAQGGTPQMHIPGLQQVAPAPLHTNHTSYGQNSQQPPNSPFAWKSDPAALFALFQASQTAGAYPPALPHAFSFPPPPLPQPSQLPEMPNVFPPQPYQPIQPAAAVAERIQEVMESDKEDGEVSEGEPVSQPSARKVNGRGRPEPPRSVPQTTHTTRRNEEAYNPDRPAAGQATAKEPLRRASQQAAPPTPIDPIQHNRDQAKQFIKLLHSNNMGYRTLADEPLDLELLRGLYQSLNLPSEPAPIVPPKAKAPAPKMPSKAPPASTAVQSVSTTKPQQQKPVAPAVKTDVKPPPPATSAASPVVDRREYVARLQAAKLAKLAGPSKLSPPQQTPPATVAPLVQAATTPQPVETPTAKLLVTEEQRAAKNELLRQRLSAFKAKQQSPPVAINPASISSPVQKPEEGRPAVEHTTQHARSGPSTPHKMSSMPSFPGIPGLFMTPSPPVIDHAAATKPVPSIPQKRSLPSEFFEAAMPRGPMTPDTRPMGLSPHVYGKQPVAIVVDKNKNMGSDMEVEDDQEPAQSAIASPSTAQQRLLPDNLPDLPHRPTPALPASPAVSTPGAQTPATQTREEELRKQEEMLAAAREKVRKQFAEKRERNRAAAAAASTGTRATSPDVPIVSAKLASEGDSSARPQPPVLDSNHSVPVASGGLFNNVSDEANELIRDVKRRRREEIQSELPTFDAELAKNVARIALLTKEMEQLKAQNERIAEDKQRLTYELESLGIDTEGMSHAEMRQMKDDIEHEQVLEVDGSLQRSEPAVQHPALEAQDYSMSHINGDENRSSFESVSGTALPLSDSASSAQYAALPRFLQDAQQPIQAPTELSQASTADGAAPAQHSTEATNETQPLLPEARLSSPENHPPTLSLDDITTSATPLDEEEFYSPAPVDELILDEVDETLAANPGSGPTHGKSPSEGGEVEMSESEEEYDPEELSPATGTPAQGAQEPSSQFANPNEMSDVTTEEEEAYEPPDIDEGISDTHIDTEEHSDGAGGFEPQVEAGDGAMDIASSSSDDSDSDSSSDGEIVMETGNDETTSANHALKEDANIADDLAPELQPETAPASLPAADDEAELVRFTPYESPLRMFKSYRYHPNFAQEVTGGFLSPTFSHQIDAEKPFCQYETAGGLCNDPECADQHFQGVGITGEILLVQLGTANPGKTTEEKQQWNDGLRGVLKELRKKSIKDPNGIAAEIAKYRREFLNDDTRVVNL